MNATKPLARQTSLTTTHVLAALLERLDNSTIAVGAEQYRSVVLHLAHEFNQVQTDSGLGALLDAHPAAAQLYENVNYTHAGLCRSSLEVSLAAEQQAKSVIERAMRAPKKGIPDGQS